ncbi:hypothetical protein K0M31_012762, partial [Melipona bicolor]
MCVIKHAKASPTRPQPEYTTHQNIKQSLVPPAAEAQQSATWRCRLISSDSKRLVKTSSRLFVCRVLPADSFLLPRILGENKWLH